MKRTLLIMFCAFALPMAAHAQTDSGNYLITHAQGYPADNAEITALFDADQAVRQDFTPEKAKDPAFIKSMIDGDQQRRERVDALLSDGALSSANDYYHAAFIYQHGSDPDSYLLAHSLAVAAVAKGHDKASWIAAATLDRYLMAIGQRQIYGTQFMSRDGDVTMEPYDTELVPDALRSALGVPDRAAQLERLEGMKARD